MDELKSSAFMRSHREIMTGRLLIEGAWRAASDGQTEPTIDPATAAPISEFQRNDNVAAVVLLLLTNANITTSVFDVDAGSLIA